MAGARHRRRRGGAGDQRADRHARQGHRRQVVGRPGDRLGGQEDQRGLLHPRRVKRSGASKRPPGASARRYRDTGAAVVFLLPLFVLVVSLIAYTFVSVICSPIGFMARPAGAMASVVVANWWRGFPCVCVSYLAAMQAIPREHYDAASVDGAGAWRRFIHITLPGLRHVMIVTFVLSFILTINDFNIIYVMTRGGPGTATQVLATYSYQVAFNQLRWGRGVTISIFLVPVLIVAIALISRYLLKDRE